MSADDLVPYLMDKLDRQPTGRRFILGIVGSPGSGKTTVAESLAAAINERRAGKAIAVPMDGFHRYKADLEQAHLLPLRGVPETFRPLEFIQALKALRQVPAVRCSLPGFSRKVDDPTEGMIVVQPQHQLVIVEGNYLLLQQPPWNEIRPLLDEAWFLKSSREIIVPRLMERHISTGMTEEQARVKVASTDLPNADLVEATRALADREI